MSTVMANGTEKNNRGNSANLHAYTCLCEVHECMNIRIVGIQVEK